MKGEVLADLQVQIYRETVLPELGRIVLVEPLEDQWPSITLANHNVFRLDAAGKVVWQVRRDERGHVNWEVRHAHATKENPDAEGYFDPFQHLSLDETRAQSPAPQGAYRPGCVIYLLTRWWAYVLDVETGVATCTGEQVK